MILTHNFDWKRRELPVDNHMGDKAMCQQLHSVSVPPKSQPIDIWEMACDWLEHSCFWREEAILFRFLI